jgi:tRNA-dihydrouridine synthase
VLVGRGVLRNPWILAQAADIAAGRPPRTVTLEERGQFLLEYIDLLLNERVGEADGFRHEAPGVGVAAPDHAPARGHQRWVINKLRALCSWYTKGIEGGPAFRQAVNHTESLSQLRELIISSFCTVPEATPAIPLSQP